MGYSHGEKWDDTKVKERIMNVVESCNLNRMPSRTEVENFYGNTSLANVISKRYGWRNLAGELKLAIKDSETKTGNEYELIAKKELESRGYKVKKMPQNFPYDLLVNDCLKIDIKSSNLYKGKKGNFYSFNLEKPYTTCDIYMLYFINEKQSERSVIILPSKFVSAQTQISIGEIKSKYNKFVGQWKYIKEYTEFFEKIS